MALEDSSDLESASKIRKGFPKLAPQVAVLRQRCARFPPEKVLQDVAAIRPERARLFDMILGKLRNAKDGSRELSPRSGLPAAWHVAIDSSPKFPRPLVMLELDNSPSHSSESDV